VAVPHNLLLVIHAVLSTGKPYRERSPTANSAQTTTTHRTRCSARTHVRQLEQLGYTVTLVPKDAA
jgi:hypothetical protein